MILQILLTSTRDVQDKTFRFRPEPVNHCEKY